MRDGIRQHAVDPDHAEPQRERRKQAEQQQREALRGHRIGSNVRQRELVAFAVKQGEAGKERRVLAERQEIRRGSGSSAARGFCEKTRTSRSGSGYGNGFSSTPLTTL